MKTAIVSYSSTGNNEKLAASLAATLGAEHIRITEPKTRTMGKIVLDTILNRTPKITMPNAKMEKYDLVLFAGPVWMGQVASPFRACFKQLKQQLGDYAFISICGGADGPNPKLGDDLRRRLGKDPVALIELHIAELLPPEPKPARDDTMAYRITAGDTQHLTDTIVDTLEKSVAA